MGTGGIARTVEKRCCVCGVDVAGAKRTKDQAGNYYCQPCYLKALAKVQPSAAVISAAPVVEAQARPSVAEDSAGLYPCPECGGLFSESAMDESGVCSDCFKAGAASDRPKPTRSRSKVRRIIIIAVGAVAAVWVIFFLISLFVFRSTREDVEAANRKIEAADERLIEKAKADAAAVREQPSEPVAPRRLSRGELVDNDPTLSSIASRGIELDNALRGVSGGSLANSTLRLAWTSEVITYEEYQYAQKFRHQQGEYP